MPDQSGHTKPGRKFEQVLTGARDVFLRDGFERASVDDIARASGVSKATIYSYFSDKRHLFTQVVSAECLRQADHAIALLDPNAPIADILHEVGAQIIGFINSDFGQRIYRICIAETDRFPQIGRAFYASGPELLRDRMVGLLQAAIDKGELAIDDVPLAAEQFPELCKVNLFPRLNFNGETVFSDAETNRVLNGAVAMFMARYGV